MLPTVICIIFVGLQYFFFLWVSNSFDPILRTSLTGGAVQSELYSLRTNGGEILGWNELSDDLCYASVIPVLG